MYIDHKLQYWIQFSQMLLTTSFSKVFLEEYSILLKGYLRMKELGSSIT